MDCHYVNEHPDRYDPIKIRDVPAVVREMTGMEVTESCIRLWINKGKLSYTGKRVFLEASMISTTKYSNRDLLEKFFQEVDK